MSRFIPSIVAAALVTTLSGCSESLSPEDFYGTWADIGVKLTLSATQARFETSCWAGDLAIPVQVDGDRFTAIGSLNSQGGVGFPESRAVIVHGVLDDDELHVSLESSLSLGPYVLRQGVDPNIPGCP